MAKDYHIMDKGQARKSIKSLMYEVTNLSPFVVVVVVVVARVCARAW